MLTKKYENYLFKLNFIDIRSRYNIGKFMYIDVEGNEKMKISGIGSYTNYYNIKNVKCKNKDTESKKYDTIQINKSTAMNINEKGNSFDISKLKQKLMDETTEDLSKSRIEKIKSQIKNKTYSIDPDELAKIILNI